MSCKPLKLQAGVCFQKYFTLCACMWVRVCVGVCFNLGLVIVNLYRTLKASLHGKAVWNKNQIFFVATTGLKC